MRFLRFWKCLKTTWNSPGQPVELAQKLATETVSLHLWYSFVVTIAGDYYKVFNAMEFHIFQLLKVKYSNIACFLSMRPFLINNRNTTGNSVEKHYFVLLNVNLQVKLSFKTFYWLLKLLYTAFALSTTTERLV